MTRSAGPRGTAGSDSPRILVVESDALHATLVARVLAAESYRVTAVADLEEGRATAADLAFDLVVIGVGEPRRGERRVADGVKFAQRLRRANPSAPILFLSSTGVSIEDLDLGGSPWSYLHQPFDIDMLTAHVRALLET